MEKIQVTAKVPGNKEKGIPDRVATVNVPFAKDCDEMITAYGKEAVFSNAKANAVITLQSRIRSLLKGGKDGKNPKSPADIEKELATYKMGVSARRIADPVGAIEKKAEDMSPDQIKDLITKLKGKLNK